MKISDISIRRPVTTFMAVLLVVLLGLISLGKLKLDLFPRFSFPVAAVITEYSGAGPNEVENMVTRPLESSLATVTNVKSISSTSSAGRSLILLEFNWGVDMDFAALEMREKVDLVKGFLPDDVDDPLVVKFDPAMLPVLQVGISGRETLVELKQIVEDKIIPGLERLEGVASVVITGGLNREILIEIDQTKLNTYGLSLVSVAQALMLENMNLTGGKIVRGNTELLVRTTGKFSSIDDIKNIQLPASSGFIALGDIASVRDTYQEIEDLARLNGQPSIGLTIQKQTDANTVMVSNRVKRELSKIIEELDNGLKVAYLMDQARFIELSIGNVIENASLGAIIAALVLFVFLKNWRSTLIIALAIPISVITTFTLIYFGGLTLNLMTLGGLALGIGMLVDNSIVVLENIFRLRQEGYGWLRAASAGSDEVGMAIIASTLTTAVVFLPVVFVEGIASELFKEMALTVTFSLLASLLVALTLIPLLSTLLLRSKDNFSGRKEIILPLFKNLYRKGLNWCLEHRIAVIFILAFLLAVSAYVYSLIGQEFIPAMDQGEFIINVELPRGTLLEETDCIVRQIEEKLKTLPEVDTIFTSVGSTGELFRDNRSETARVTVRLKSIVQRNRSTDEIMEELRDELKFPGVKISLQKQDAFMTSMGEAPVSIRIKGNDLGKLEELVREVREEIEGMPEIREVQDSITRGRPELQISIDRSKAARLGLRVTSVASAIKSAVQGEVATRYEVGGREYDVRVRLQEKDRKGIDDLKDLLIPSPLGARVPLSSISEFTITRGPKSILRENQERYAEVTADIYNADLGTVMEKVEKRLTESIDLPPDYEFEFSGQYEEMVESFSSLRFALILALILVYMVMASQFESLLSPFIIMFTIPMAAIGIIFSLFLTGNNISVPVIIGIIMLAGIVVNNAIVLVDYINRLKMKGLDVKEAILKAGAIRLRPILMTALTTILGLIPLVLDIGEGSEVQVPLAVVVIGGLSFSTLLTLFIIPVFYSLLHDLQNKVTAFFRG